MLHDKGKYFMVPVLPLFVYLSYCMVATKHYHKLGNEIVEHFHPFTPNNIPLTPFQNHQHSKILISVIEQFFSQFDEISVYQYVEHQSFIEDIRLYVPLFPVVTPQLTNSHRGPPCFA